MIKPFFASSVFSDVFMEFINLFSSLKNIFGFLLLLLLWAGCACAVLLIFFGIIGLVFFRNKIGPVFLKIAPWLVGLSFIIAIIFMSANY